MKIYGLATAIYQSGKQDKSSTHSTLSLTPVVFDSEQKTFEQTTGGNKKLEFKVDSKQSILNAVDIFCRTVSEVAELQQEANKHYKTNYQAQILFGIEHQFIKHLDQLNSFISKISRAPADEEQHPLSQLGDYLENILHERKILKFNMLAVRAAALNEEALKELKEFDLSKVSELNPTEISEEEIEELIASTAQRISTNILNNLIAGRSNTFSTFALIAPRTNCDERGLQIIKTISMHSELRERASRILCKKLGNDSIPMTIKTPFDPPAPAFFDVLSSDLAALAVKAIPTLKNQMLGTLFVP